MAESMLCRANNREVSPQFYALKTRLYRMVSQLLYDPERSFHGKVEGMNQLANMALYLGALKEHEEHIQAMYRYILSWGGFQRFLYDKIPVQGVLDLAFYTSNLMYIRIPIMSQEDLTTTLDNVVASFDQARCWSAQFQPIGDHDHSGSPRMVNLRLYLDWLIDTYLSNSNTRHHLIVGALNFIHSLCMSAVIYNYDRWTAGYFLDQVEASMQQHSQAQRQSPRSGRVMGSTAVDLVPVSHIVRAGACMLSYVRRLVVPNLSTRREEVELCEASLGLIRLVPLMSRFSIMSLATELKRCTFCVIEPNNDAAGRGIFNEGFLQYLRFEIEEAWKKSCKA